MLFTRGRKRRLSVLIVPVVRLRLNDIPDQALQFESMSGRLQNVPVFTGQSVGRLFSLLCRRGFTREGKQIFILHGDCKLRYICPGCEKV